MKVEFGYYPRPLSLSVGGIEIRTLPNLEDSLALIGDEGVDADWIYAPPQKVHHSDGGCHYIRTKPYASRIFSLPKTHELRCADADSSDHIAFLLWALSLFKGMRLTAIDRGFVDATPIRPGMLNDFALRDSSLIKAIELADKYWKAHQSAPEKVKLFGAAVHALFLSRNPQLLQFESFNFVYFALDCCFALIRSPLQLTGRIPHRERIMRMCEHFGMPIPEWARIVNRETRIANLRNNAIHEALFNDQPLGFSVYGAGTSENITLEMQALTCRFLVAILGAKENKYFHTPVNTGLRYFLTL